MRILLIDDDEELMEIVAQKLIEQYYAVDIAITGEMGKEFILLFHYDLIVLDWMLPDLNGVELCRQIRTEGYEMPIVFLTARDGNSDKVIGLDAGADDYVVKPFDFEELTARIRALLRRDIHATSPILEWQDLSLNPKTHEVFSRQELLPLTPKEYAMLELFMRHPQQVFSPSAIIENLWAGEDPPGEEAVRTHIKGLRQKLKQAGMSKDTVQTVYGVGYRLKAFSKTDASTSENLLSSSEEISRAWWQFREVAFQRLAVLEELVTALPENGLTAELYSQARNTAHKLAGSLGGFGLSNGSKIARQIEIILNKDSLDRSEIKEYIAKVSLLRQELQASPAREQSNDISLLIIDSDRNYTKQLVTEANNHKIKTQTAFSLDEAQKIAEAESFTAVLHAIAFPDGKDLRFLANLHQQQPHLPIVIITEDALLSDRLEIVRKGGNLILQAPIAPQTAIDSTLELIKTSSNAAKLLVVDDDPQFLSSLKISLQPWGFQLLTLDRPQQLWDVLADFEPDLLILDIEMPELNGLEVCQLLRSDRKWQTLPILFLTAHQDDSTQNQAFAIGADDYICKPIIASELANRILNRLHRNRILKS